MRYTTSISLILLGCWLLTSCRQEPGKAALPLTTSPPQVTSDTAAALPTFDTTMVVSGLENSTYRGRNLTETLAKKTLYRHFSGKGYFNEDNLPDMDKLTDADNDKRCVSFNKIFLTDLNGNSSQDAIITYWVTPPYANGHCWQPHKSIILDTEKGYKITHEDFIPENFAIDSVRNGNGQVTLYGYDYDCGKRKVLRNFRVKISREQE